MVGAWRDSKWAIKSLTDSLKAVHIVRITIKLTAGLNTGSESLNFCPVSLSALSEGINSAQFHSLNSAFLGQSTFKSLAPWTSTHQTTLPCCIFLFLLSQLSLFRLSCNTLWKGGNISVSKAAQTHLLVFCFCCQQIIFFPSNYCDWQGFRKKKQSTLRAQVLVQNVIICVLYSIGFVQCCCREKLNKIKLWNTQELIKKTYTLLLHFLEWAN